LPAADITKAIRMLPFHGRTLAEAQRSPSKDGELIAGLINL